MANNCSNCGTCTDKCKCIPKGVTTPSYCITDKPSCPEPDPCSETIDSNCVIYTGANCDLLEFQSGNTMQTFVNKVCEYLESGPCCYMISLTNAELLTLIENGEINSAFYYMVTDPENAKSVIVQGITSNSVTLHGAGIFLNADYQAVGDYSSLTGTITNIRIWSSVSQTVTPNNVVIWNNKHYRNKTGNWGSAPSTDSINWEELTKSITTGFIQEIDFIKYNPLLNKVIYRADKRSNEVELYNSYQMDDFQWGRDLVLGNKVLAQSKMNCVNSKGEYKGNYLTSESSITDAANGASQDGKVYYNTLSNTSKIEILNVNEGDINNNTLSNGSIIRVTDNLNDISVNTLTTGSGIIIETNNAEIEQNTLQSQSYINVPILSDGYIRHNVLGTRGRLIVDNFSQPVLLGLEYGVINKDIYVDYLSGSDSYPTVVHNISYSNLPISLNMDNPSYYNASTETLTIPHQQFGIVRLENFDGKTISKIQNLSPEHVTRFDVLTTQNDTPPYSDKSVTFQHTSINTATNYDLVCDAPNSANTLVARDLGRDFVEYKKLFRESTNNNNDGVNIRINLVKLA